MKHFEWNEIKNKWLKEHRNISFEEIIYFIEHGGLIDSYEHPNKIKYPRQLIFVVQTNAYVYVVPYIDEGLYYFLKTIIPSRQSKKQYGENKNA